jgi:hypothetical protein
MTGQAKSWPLITPFRAASAMAAATFAVYAATLYPSIAGGDAGELVTAAVTGGTPHPPGYPLFALLARGAAALIPFGEVAWRVNLVMAAVAAAAAGVLCAAVALLSGRWWAGVLAAGLFAFSPGVWEYAAGAEVFPLNNLLAAGLILLAVLHVRQGGERFALAGAAAFGLGMANHHTILFLGIPLAVMLLVREPAHWLRPLPFARLLLCFTLGLLPYLYLPIASATMSEATWGDQRTVGGFLAHLLRQEYGTLRLGAEAYQRDVSFTQQLGLYATFQFREMLFVGVPLALAGLWAGLRSAATRPVAAWLAASLVLYLLVFHALANLPIGNPLFLGVQERFWQMPGLIVAALAGLGAAALLQRSPAWLKGAPAAAALLVLLQAGLHYARQDRSDAWEFRDYGRALLEPLPAGALLLARGDLIINTLHYAQLVDGFRTDVRVVDLERITYPWMTPVLAVRMPDVLLPGGRLGPDGFTLRDLIIANEGARPLFLAGNLAAWEGDVASGWVSWPWGMTSRLLPAGSEVDTGEWMLASQAALPAFPLPPPSRRDPRSWSRVVWHDAVGARHSRVVRILELGISSDDRELLSLAARELQAIVDQHPDATPLAWKNLGIAWGRLAAWEPALEQQMRAAWSEYVARGDASDPQMPAIRLLLQAPAANHMPAAPPRM